MKKKQFKVLVVDDSSFVRKIINEELTEGGYQVIEAANGIEAIAKSTKAPLPDLITLDVDMPKLNGFETCAKLRSESYSRFFTNYPDHRIPIIFVTGSDNLTDRQKGFHAGASDFITKPFEKGEILEAVDSILKPKKHMEGLTVLIVDDNAVARKIISNALGNEGTNIIEAKDGAEAFDIMCKQMSSIDLLVTDHIMPIMSGEELCRKIRSELSLKDLPIIFLSAVEEQNEILKFFKAGANDYLIKPFAKEELLARLNVHLHSAQLKKRLRTNIGELESLNQMKDDLISVCSHDLRSPLNGILGFTDLLLEKDSLENEDLENLRNVKTSAEFLLSLVNDILDLSKIKANESFLEMEALSISEAVQSSVNAMQYMATAKGIEIKYSNKSKRNIIIGNKNGLVRTFNNLLSNSIKFTPSGKNITMSIENLADDSISITVIDEGIGIPADKLPVLFDKFSSSSRDGTCGEKGTGLGMSIIKEMVEKHNGTIEVVSTEGVGSKFIVSLPLADQSIKISAANNGTKESASPPVGRHNILIAEDNPVNCKLAVKLLEKTGQSVVVVENGLKAVKYVQENDIDLIFMDIHMPEMGGLVATKTLRGLGVGIPIIALTGSTSQKDIGECINAGMNDHICKPFKANDLNTMIAKWGSKN